MNIKSILNELDDELKGTFHTQETLEPKIWPFDKKLRPSIRKRLMEIAQDFYNSLETDAELKDVTFTGSLANYNWSGSNRQSTYALQRKEVFRCPPIY
jgi:hypothetical protein